MTQIPRSSNEPAALARELANLVDDDGDDLTAPDWLLSLEVRANWWRVIDAVTGVFEPDAGDALSGNDLRYVACALAKHLALREGDPIDGLKAHAEGLQVAGTDYPGASRLDDLENTAEALITAAAILERLNVAGLMPLLDEVRAYVRAGIDR